MKKTLLLFILFPISIIAQGYTSYFTGNTTNITTTTELGICLMGGATEHDNAMRWLLQKANGGDVVVLRSSGSNGYNDYLYTDLGITVNSVETLVITSIAGATNQYVLDKVANAEMIWFAGGDQFNYISYFKNNALENLINNHINVKQAPIGGTSAGMAILCGKYFSAQNGTVTSTQALSNPYNSLMTLGNNDFLEVPFLQKVTTDTHFDYYDRKGRLTAFLAKTTMDQNTRSFGIAANEYVAICIDQNGKASVYGDYPNYQEFAFFVQSNCQDISIPENCEPNSNLTWNRNGEAVKAYKVPGTMNGSNYFQLTNWTNGSGGNWENWIVNNGVFSSNDGSMSECTLTTNNFNKNNIQIFPVPFENNLEINLDQISTIIIYDSFGRIMHQNKCKNLKFDTTLWSSGIYLISIVVNGEIQNKKIVKK